MGQETTDALIWGISVVAVAGVILRPFSAPEWIFAVGGAALLAALRLIGMPDVLRGVESGTDVYLFLAGMMLLAEVARREGLFDYLAAHAARAAGGSPRRLFALVYLVGTLVTVFLSNDATAVVLTPAVAAVARAAQAKTPVPYLLVCAFVANAASFVLPISNPANLVIFGAAMPPLGDWLARLLVPSLVSIGATYAVLYWTQRADLCGRTSTGVPTPELGLGGRIAALGITIAAAGLLTASALGSDLGWPTALAGVVTALAVVVAEGRSPLPVVRAVSWDTLLLVAGLFVIVRGLETTGLKAMLAASLERLVATAPALGPGLVGVGVGVATNLTNNLPLGLVGGAVVQAARVPAHVADSVLIGIDIGPNLSVTGSLATILWLTALRREGISFGSIRFLKVGALVMPPALVLALSIRVLLP
ncbi:MAG: arsenic transporter [Pararhizobium sp.]